MLANDRKIFSKAYDYWLDRQTPQLETFLKRTCATVKASVEQASDTGANFRPIESYFPPTIPQDTIFDIILGTTYHPPEPD